MTSVSTIRRRTIALIGGAAVASLILSGCAPGNGSGDSGVSGAISVGTTGKVTTIDPAGSLDGGSSLIMNNVFPFLMNSNPGSTDVQPDIAESAEFTAPNEYTVVLKSNLKWANGNDLTASDVKFSFDRQVAIAADSGPSTLLSNLDSTEMKDDVTVVFHLKAANDQVWPQILSSPAGAIVDEEVFAADELTADDEIVEGMAFAGPYAISSYKFNEFVQFKVFDGYQGMLESPKIQTINLKYYADPNTMHKDVQVGNIDVAIRSLTPIDIESLSSNKDITVHKGPGGEIRAIAFNFDTMPFGAKTAEPDASKALAVRQAIADLIDRDAIASEVYKGAYLPLYSYVPVVLNGDTEDLKDLYGDGRGGPDVAKAKSALDAAHVVVPVTLDLQFNSDQYGASSREEYALIKSQLESSGLFTVNLESAEWVRFSKERSADVYPLYQFNWIPYYSGVDNYLSPLFRTNSFLKNHFRDAEIDAMIQAQAVEMSAVKRESDIGDIQAKLAAKLPIIPILQGGPVVVAGKDVNGVDDTLDASFKFRFNVLSK